MLISEVIRKIRWELRLSQKELAKAVKCTQTAISAYELGHRKPHYDILKRLDEFAKQHKVEVSFL